MKNKSKQKEDKINSEIILFPFEKPIGGDTEYCLDSILTNVSVTNLYFWQEGEKNICENKNATYTQQTGNRLTRPHN